MIISVGLEFNKQTKYSDVNLFYSKADELNMIKIIGSDSHTIDSLWYDDINFYKANKSEIKKLLNKAKEYMKYSLT